ncbi:DUF2914 domain-containing protein [Thermodesulfobacteriota bacterium]
MHKQCCLLFGFLVIVLVTICLSAVPVVSAQEANPIDVADAVICRGVANHKAVDPATRFSSSVGKLYCFSRLVGAKNATHITHVWYYGNVERARLSLPVKSADWRTFSTKKIRLREAGVWHVDILDASGNRLEVLNFHIEK